MYCMKSIWKSLKSHSKDNIYNINEIIVTLLFLQEQTKPAFKCSLKIFIF